jgi:hypothetical protein
MVKVKKADHRKAPCPTLILSDAPIGCVCLGAWASRRFARGAAPTSQSADTNEDDNQIPKRSQVSAEAVANHQTVIKRLARNYRRD